MEKAKVYFTDFHTEAFGDGLPTKLANFILGISSNQLVIMFLLFALLIVVGMFMDATAAIYILVPILLPVVKQLGVKPLFFVVFLVIALSFGLITPPVGVCLYAAENVTGLPLEKVIKSVVPWLFLTVGILCLFIHLTGTTDQSLAGFYTHSQMLHRIFHPLANVGNFLVHIFHDIICMYLTRR